MKSSTGALLAVPVVVLAGLLAFLLLLAPAPQDAAADACDLGGTSVVVDPTTLPEAPVEGFGEVELTNAALIMTVAAEKGMSQQAAAIAVMTAIRESGLRNLANRGEFQRPATSRVMTEPQWQAARAVAVLSLGYPNDGAASGDWDSIGLFQGRPSTGWGGQGSPEQQVQNLLDPAYTAGRFLDALAAVDGWETLEPTVAAQRVQRSAFPDAYAEHWDQAVAIVGALAGVETSTAACAGGATHPGTVSADGWTQPVAGSTYTSAFGPRTNPVTRVRQLHAGSDYAAPAGTPIYAAAAGTVVNTSCESFQGRSPCNVQIDHGVNDAGQRVTTLYVHMYPGTTHVQVGQVVEAGHHIADVGSYGNSTGPHLHFEVWLDSEPVDPAAFLAQHDVGMP